MSPYRPLIVSIIVFSVLFYGFTNFVKAGPMSADCDYMHVAMLFGARGYMIDYSASLWSDRRGIFVVTTRHSFCGLDYDPTYDLNNQNPCWWQWIPMTTSVSAIDMRDVAQAIRNYQKLQST